MAGRPGSDRLPVCISCFVPSWSGCMRWTASLALVELRLALNLETMRLNLQLHKAGSSPMWPGAAAAAAAP